MATTNGAGNGTSNGTGNGTSNSTAENTAENTVKSTAKSASNEAGNPTGNRASRRASRSRAKAASSGVELEHNMTGISEMSEAEKTANGGANAAKAGKLELSSKPEPTEASLAVHESGELEVAESYSEAGVRPIEVSHLEVYGMILNNRPISTSHLQVVEYVGNRPIFASEMVICDDLTLPGGRPIVASDARLMEASLITGGRPIASNDMGEGETLMGYLD